MAKRRGVSILVQRVPGGGLTSECATASGDVGIDARYRATRPYPFGWRQPCYPAFNVNGENVGLCRVGCDHTSLVVTKATFRCAAHPKPARVKHGVHPVVGEGNLHARIRQDFHPAQFAEANHPLLFAAVVTTLSEKMVAPEIAGWPFTVTWPDTKARPTDAAPVRPTPPSSKRSDRHRQ